MSSPSCIALAIVVFELIFPANVSTARAQQKPPTADQSQIVDTISTIFAAARTDDVAKFDSVIASDFYIFDGGARFNGDTVMALLGVGEGARQGESVCHRCVYEHGGDRSVTAEV